MLSCKDRPSPGFISYSTLTLHTAPNILDGAQVPVEMAGVAPATATRFPNVLATAAFFVIKDGWLCAPGVVFLWLIRRYEPQLSSTLDHVMWTPPFPWDQLGSVQLADDLTAHWLLALPISEAENRFLMEHGYDALESLFIEAELEYFDLGRPSVV